LSIRTHASSHARDLLTTLSQPSSSQAVPSTAPLVSRA
jgi:hypothetical protein